MTIKIVQDLTQCDGDREELNIIKENIIIKDQYIETQDSIIKTQESKIQDYKYTINAHQYIDSSHVNITKSLNEKANIYKKERNWYRIAAVILLIISIIK